MNDIIKTLIEQSKLTSTDDWEEPFAEAITKECDNIIDCVNKDNCDNISESITALEQIVNLMQLEQTDNRVQQQTDCIIAKQIIDNITKL